MGLALEGLRQEIQRIWIKAEVPPIIIGAFGTTTKKLWKTDEGTRYPCFNSVLAEDNSTWHFFLFWKKPWHLKRSDRPQCQKMKNEERWRKGITTATTTIVVVVIITIIIITTTTIIIIVITRVIKLRQWWSAVDLFLVSCNSYNPTQSKTRAFFLSFPLFSNMWHLKISRIFRGLRLYSWFNVISNFNYTTKMVAFLFINF